MKKREKDFVPEEFFNPSFLNKCWGLFQTIMNMVLINSWANRKSKLLYLKIRLFSHFHALPQMEGKTCSSKFTNKLDPE